MMPTFAADVVRVLRPALRESRGSKVRDWENATSEEYHGCSFQFSATSADNSTADDVASQAVLYGPYDMRIENGDVVEYYGEYWAVQGRPHHWRDAFGRPSHTVASLKMNGGGRG